MEALAGSYYFAATRPRIITKYKVVLGNTDLCRTVYVGPGTKWQTVFIEPEPPVAISICYHHVRMLFLNPRKP